MLTGLAVGAGRAAPRALVLHVARHAEAAVRVIPVRAQDLALVQRDAGGVHVVIPVPDDGHLRLVLSRVRLVGILETYRP